MTLSALRRRGIRGLWTALLVLTAPTAAAADKGAEVDAGAWYRACMELVRSDPDKALVTARARLKQGDGDGAGHCEAAALAGLERYAEAGQRFEALAWSSAAGAEGRRAALLGAAAQA